MEVWFLETLKEANFTRHRGGLGQNGRGVMLGDGQIGFVLCLDM